MESIRKEIVKLYNIFAVKHLQKSENELAKYYLDLCEKFPCNDVECHLITKNNYSCYYSNVGQYRNAKNIMGEIVKLNLTKKSSEIIKDQNESQKSPSEDDCNYSYLANDFSNLCALSNKVKK